MEQENKQLVGRIAGMALTKLAGMKSATGVYFKVVEVTGGDVKVICTNPGLSRMERTFPIEQFRQQLRSEIISGQLAPVNGDLLDYVAKCYLTERQADENDETLKARLNALALGPNAMN
jgi:hypothetical protein